MVEEIRQGRYSDASDIVFVHTGGLFGLLAQQQQLNY
jgi:D-cysteine desulfhydrase